MRFPVSLTICCAVAALLACTDGRLSAQESSSQSQAPQPTTPQPSPSYVVIDPLAGVRYDNKWDLSVEFAYAHVKAGPNLLQGANLGGPVTSVSYYLSKRWRLEGTFRPYLGTSGAAPNTFINSSGQPYSIKGPFIAQYIFAAGGEWLGPHNKHGALIAHILGGGAYGDFEHDLLGQSPQLVGFYNTQVAPAMIMGGHVDLNRSAHWVFRMTPDAILTDYAIHYGQKNRQIDINAAFSVGIQYKFMKTPKKH